MARHRSRRYEQSAAKLERNKRYPLEDGISLLKSLDGPKFDESVDLVVRIGIDPKKTDQLVRGSVALPNGTGKSIKIAVFADGDKAFSVSVFPCVEDHVGLLKQVFDFGAIKKLFARPDFSFCYDSM